MGGFTSKIVSRLAFHPPVPPTYKLTKTEGTDAAKSSWTIASEFHKENKNIEVLRVPTHEGQRIVAIFVRNQAAKLTILYSHGNAEDFGSTIDLILKLSRRLCVNVMTYDYSGYGQSTGYPSETNAYADIEAVYRCLLFKYGIREGDIILYGHSIGTGPTVELATQLPGLRGIILQAGLLSAVRVVCSLERTCYFDIFNNVDKIEKVKCPVLVIHGTCDEVVDVSHGKKLWELCKVKCEPLWVEGGGHCNLLKYPQVRKHLMRFVSAVEENCRRKNSSTVIQLKTQRE